MTFATVAGFIIPATIHAILLTVLFRLWMRITGYRLVHEDDLDPYETEVSVYALGQIDPIGTEKLTRYRLHKANQNPLDQQ